MLFWDGFIPIWQTVIYLSVWIHVSPENIESSVRCPKGQFKVYYFLILTRFPFGEVIRRYGVSFRSYADDTQFYIAMSSTDTGPIDTLFKFISDTKSWMAENFLQLNQGKT